MLRIQRLYNFKGLVTLLLVLSLLLSMLSFMTISASAEGIDTSAVQSAVTSDLNGDIEDVGDTEPGAPADDVIVEENPSDASLEQTNEYLRYITGFLLFIVICIIIWAVIKFFDMFF